jgi:hypothetical protein
MKREIDIHINEGHIKSSGILHMGAIDSDIIDGFGPTRTDRL